MKKFACVLSAILLAVSFFAGCSKEKNIDSQGWIDNLQDGKSAAQKENKNILIFFSSEDDGISVKLKKELFELPSFINEFSSKYVFVNLDFSQSVFDAAQPSADAAPEDNEKATELADKLAENIKVFRNYNVHDFPTTLIVSKDGYVIKEVYFFDKNENFQPDENTSVFDDAAVRPYSLVEAKAAMAAVEPAVTYVNDLCEKTASGAKLDRVKAIDELYMYTTVLDFQYCYLLRDLSEKVVVLDKNNESGTVGKHLLIIAKFKAQDYQVEGNFLKASDVYADIATNDMLSPDEKQSAYFNAGFILASNNSNNYSKIVQYCDAAIAASPESEGVPEIESFKALAIAALESNIEVVEEIPADPESKVE